MSQLLDLLRQEWQVIAASPVTSAAVAIVSAAGAAAYLRWHFKERVERLNERIEGLKEQLSGKESLISDYRSQQGVTQGVGTRESALNSGELISDTLRFVSEFRTWIAASESSSSELFHSPVRAARRSPDEDSRRAAFEADHAEDVRLYGRIRSDYDLRFRARAIVLRDELRSRGAKGVESERHFDVYSNPTNFFGYKEVADDLEVMALRLRDA